jgi:hypothetical protein
MDHRKAKDCAISRGPVRHTLKRPRRLGLPLREPECGFIVSRLPLPSHNRVKYLTLNSVRTVQHVRRVTLLLAGETAPRRARVRAAAAAAAAYSGPIGTIGLR